MKTKRKPRPITLLPDPDSITIHLCPVCRGEKVCPYCGGKPRWSVAAGTWIDCCEACVDNPGVCPHCRGRGWV